MRNIIVLGLSITVATVTALRAEENAEDASSYFAGLAANWAGLRQYDVLVDNFSSTILGDGNSTDVEGRFRLIADHDLNRYLFIYSGSQADESPESTVKTRGLTAFYFDQESQQAWKFDMVSGVAHKLAITSNDSHSVEKTLAVSGFPEIRLIGSYEYPHTAFSEYSIDEAFEADFNAGQEMNAQTVGDATVKITVDRAYGEKVKFRRTYTFDVETLVPSSLTYIYSGADGSNPKKFRKEYYEWKKINEVYVPSSVLVENLKRGSKEPNTAIQVNSDATFKWLSVNKMIDSDLLSLDVIKSPETMLKMTSNEVSGEDTD